jgi:hypothetical protein
MILVAALIASGMRDALAASVSHTYGFEEA